MLSLQSAFNYSSDMRRISYKSSNVHHSLASFDLFALQVLIFAEELHVKSFCAGDAVLEQYQMKTIKIFKLSQSKRRNLLANHPALR